MKPSLEKILKQILSAFHMPEDDWEILKCTRVASVIQIVQAFSLVAHGFGYRHLTIGKFLGRDRTTIIYSIDKAKDLSSVYKDYFEKIQNIKESLQYDWSHSCTGYLARSSRGVLTISPTMPTRMSGYWVAEGSKAYHNQLSFPQIKWENDPVKVIIKVTIDHNEKV